VPRHIDYLSSCILHPVGKCRCPHTRHSYTRQDSYRSLHRCRRYHSTCWTSLYRPANRCIPGTFLTDATPMVFGIRHRLSSRSSRETCTSVQRPSLHTHRPYRFSRQNNRYKARQQYKPQHCTCRSQNKNLHPNKRKRRVLLPYMRSLFHCMLRSNCCPRPAG